jgi:predicted dehydrogenase
MRLVRPDLVHVVTPPTVRRSVIDEVLDGRPRALLVEKPLALEPDDAYHILDRCRSQEVSLFVNHQLRYFRPLLDLRDRIATGALGTLHTVRATTRCDLLEQGSHLFDLVSFLVGDRQEATEVFAAAQGVRSEGPTHGAPEYIAGVATLERDVRLYFECGGQAPAWPGSRNPWHQLGIELHGDFGHAGVSLNRGWWISTDGMRDHADHVHEEEDDSAQQRLIDDICRTLDAPDKHPCGPQRSLFSLQLMIAAQRSALYRSWLPVRERGTSAEFRQLRRRLAEAARPLTSVAAR